MKKMVICSLAFIFFLTLTASLGFAAGMMDEEKEMIISDEKMRAEEEMMEKSGEELKEQHEIMEEQSQKGMHEMIKKKETGSGENEEFKEEGE